MVLKMAIFFQNLYSLEIFHIEPFIPQNSENDNYSAFLVVSKSPAINIVIFYPFAPPLLCNSAKVFAKYTVLLLIYLLILDALFSTGIPVEPHVQLPLYL